MNLKVIRQLACAVTDQWPGMALDDCIRATDAALYRGKRAGKNRTASDTADGSSPTGS